MMIASQACKICSSDGLEEISDYRLLPRVTSDCHPFRAGGRLLVCPRCGAAQSPNDAQWHGEIDEIYGNYAIFHQSGSHDQQVIDPATGQLRKRCALLLDRLNIVSGGIALDVGCGSGVMVRALSERGGWRLHGLDLNERFLSALQTIPGFEVLHTCAPAELPGGYDLVTMVHSLEHFPAPLPALRDLLPKLANGGILFIEVPNAETNPFEYLVADHAIHFTPATLSLLAENAGWNLIELSTAWVLKEISLTATTTTKSPRGFDAVPAPPDASAVIPRLRSQIRWLRQSVEIAREASITAATFGLFGSSIAATWLFSEMSDRISFFVEEDKNRVGSTLFGRPIISPAEVPPESVVYLALIPNIATRVAERLCHTMRLCFPPPLVS
jgi:2-polyprenyl-3-methyl-5-hydroxy-6-metoxy-1,4-benzoquinol methylase